MAAWQAFFLVLKLGSTRILSLFSIFKRHADVLLDVALKNATAHRSWPWNYIQSSKTCWQSLGDQCQGGGGGFLSVLPTSPSGQRDHRRFHLYLSTPTPFNDRRTILSLKGNLSNSTASLSRRGRKTFSVGKVHRAGEGGGGGGGLGGREGGEPSRLRLYTCTAERRDVLGCTSPTTKRFPEVREMS